MSKLKLEDVRILGEGQQIRKAIEARYKDVRTYYESNNITMALSTFRSYLSKETNMSDTIRCIVTNTLGMDYAKVVLSTQQQITKYAQMIYDEIRKYNEDTDQEMMDYLIEETKKENMQLETAMMYRAKARNYYYTNWIDNTESNYQFAIDNLPKEEIDKLVFFYCELAFILQNENLMEKSHRKFRIAEEHIRKNKESLSSTTLFYYYYWRGIYYLSEDKYDTARKYFEEAIKHAVKNYEKAGAVSNKGLTYKYQENYVDAIKYYYEALDYYDEENVSTTASVNNNIAEVYRIIEDYENALEYIKIAMDMVEKESDLTKMLIYAETYVEILSKLGETEAYEIYLDKLLSTKGKQLNKADVIHNIKQFIKTTEDKRCLNRLFAVIMELADASTSQGYTDGLYQCLGHVSGKLYKLYGVVFDEKKQ